MKKCGLCGRKTSNVKYNYGLGCLKKLCNFIRINNVKNLKVYNMILFSN